MTGWHRSSKDCSNAFRKWTPAVRRRRGTLRVNPMRVGLDGMVAATLPCLTVPSAERRSEEEAKFRRLLQIVPDRLETHRGKPSKARLACE